MGDWAPPCRLTDCSACISFATIRCGYAAHGCLGGPQSRSAGNAVKLITELTARSQHVKPLKKEARTRNTWMKHGRSRMRTSRKKADPKTAGNPAHALWTPRQCSSFRSSTWCAVRSLPSVLGCLSPAKIRGTSSHGGSGPYRVSWRRPQGHRLPRRHCVVATPILGGLHHEYRLAREAA